jgi:hypothetical protein
MSFLDSSHTLESHTSESDCDITVALSCDTISKKTDKEVKLVLSPMNRSFTRRLNSLIFEAMDIQYNLACLSTLGGAYHLCNYPETALMIAVRQEMFAKKLGSTSVMLRSKVFQAVNLGLLGKEKESVIMFKYCMEQSVKEGWTDMSSFVEASRSWLNIEQLLKKKKNQGAGKKEKIGDKNGQITFPVSGNVEELKEQRSIVVIKD